MSFNEINARVVEVQIFKTKEISLSETVIASFFLSILVELSQSLRSDVCLIKFLVQQQEQDPTNLYIANLPLTFKESDMESMLSQYGHVVSTRILRDTATDQSKGVGFARFVLLKKKWAIFFMLLLQNGI